MTAPELVVSCAIRGTLVDGVATFAAIDEGGHRPFGVVRVEKITYGFRLWHDRLEALGDAQVTADETLGDLGLSTHASWGMEYVDVTLRRAGVKVPAAQMCVPYANAWVHLTGYRESS